MTRRRLPRHLHIAHRDDDRVATGGINSASPTVDIATAGPVHGAPISQTLHRAEAAVNNVDNNITPGERACQAFGAPCDAHADRACVPGAIEENHRARVGMCASVTCRAS